MPLEYNIVPLTRAQRDTLQAIDGTILLSGPWGTGKTHSLADKGLLWGYQYPGSQIALARKTADALRLTLWKVFIEKILSRLPENEVVAANETTMYRRLRNGTEYYGGGLDSASGKINKFASREYNLMLVEEAKEIDEADLEEKVGRCMRLPGFPLHQVILATNPDSPNHHLYKRFYLAPHPGDRLIEGTVLPPPFLPESYYERLRQLKGIYFQRYAKGLWTAAIGLVYPFDPTKHLITKEQFRERTGRDEIPADWKRVLSIDFGFDHPFVAHWWAVSPDDKWYLYREIYHTRRTVNTHAKTILEAFDKDEQRPVAICDHDAEDRATLQEHGIRTVPARKDRQAGQQTVFDIISEDRMYFFTDALVEEDIRLVAEGKPTRTVEEFPGHIWTSKTKEDWRKEEDDGMDTTRYAAHTTLTMPAARQYTGRY